MVVRCLKNEFVTELRENKRDHVTFDESHTWAGMKMFENQFQSTSLEFEMQSANTFWYEVFPRELFPWEPLPWENWGE